MSERLTRRAQTSSNDETLSLGEALRVLRENTDKSARSLSLDCNLSPSYVSKLEAGTIQDTSLRAFARIVVELGLTAREVHFLIRQEASR